MSEPQPRHQLTRMITAYWTSRAIYVAAKLRVADHLADGPRSAEELAAAAGVAPRPLYRVLRALAGVGIFAREADGRFRLNPLAEPLREDGPESIWAYAVAYGEEMYRCWDGVPETVRTGEPAFDRMCGRPFFAYLGEHPEQARIFDGAMAGSSGRAMEAMLDAYDLSGVGTLAGGGGGGGSNLARALGRYPAMRGVLFDLPHVVGRARPRLEAAGVAGRCAVEAGASSRLPQVAPMLICSAASSMTGMTRRPAGSWPTSGVRCRPGRDSWPSSTSSRLATACRSASCSTST
ncbi:MAG: methylase RsmC [Gemmataceae bacterium]|nr:methylase RsmC [Gemmataceae bacterium]